MPLHGQHCLIVVLGDIGRSPRMQYHALSIANTMKVTIVGYLSSKCFEPVATHENIHIQSIQPVKWHLPRSLFILWAPFKVMWQILQLLFVLLFMVSSPNVILVQNPPSIPTLIITRLVAWLRCSKFIIDWHNFGYTILALNLSASHVFVRIARVYERWFGRLADGHLCVTHAMSKELRDNWSIDAVVLHDRPPEFYRRLSAAERCHLLCRLCGYGGALSHLSWSIKRAHNPFTSPSGVALDSSRPALIVSSTSWTDDEDFSLLIDACVEYERLHNTSQTTLPRLVVVITGKGPLKEHYEREIAEKQLKHCQLVTVWLEPDDYPRLLGTADIGVSLHVSSSGLDLPMKVVDMFGCALPVCAVDFPCLDELVHNKVNGLTFSTAKELAGHFVLLLEDFPRTPILDSMRDELRAFQRTRWHTEWNACAAPLILG